MQTKSISGTTYRRIIWQGIAEGMTLYRMEPTDGGTPQLLGTVASVETDAGGTNRITLDNGRRLTRRGWQSRRFWTH